MSRDYCAYLLSRDVESEHLSSGSIGEVVSGRFDRKVE